MEVRGDHRVRNDGIEHRVHRSQVVAQSVIPIRGHPLRRRADLKQFGYQDLRGNGIRAAELLDKFREVGNAVNSDPMDAQEPLRRQFVPRINLHQFTERATGRESAPVGGPGELRDAFPELVARSKKRFQRTMPIRHRGLILCGPLLFVPRRLRVRGSGAPRRFRSPKPFAQPRGLLFLRPNPGERLGEGLRRMSQAGVEFPATPRESESGRRQPFPLRRVLLA